MRFIISITDLNYISMRRIPAPGKKLANSDELIKKAQEKLLTSVKLNPSFPQAYLVLGQISYNEAVEFQVLGKPKGNTNAGRIETKTGIPGNGS